MAKVVLTTKTILLRTTTLISLDAPDERTPSEKEPVGPEYEGDNH